MVAHVCHFDFRDVSASGGNDHFIRVGIVLGVSRIHYDDSDEARGPSSVGLEFGGVHTVAVFADRAFSVRDFISGRTDRLLFDLQRNDSGVCVVIHSGEDCDSGGSQAIFGTFSANSSRLVDLRLLFVPCSSVT